MSPALPAGAVLALGGEAPLWAGHNPSRTSKALTPRPFALSPLSSLPMGSFLGELDTSKGIPDGSGRPFDVCLGFHGLIGVS